MLSLTVALRFMCLIFTQDRVQGLGMVGSLNRSPEAVGYSDSSSKLIRESG